MIFTETKLQGVFIIDIEPVCDDRGFFARTFCKKEFEERGLETNFVQCSTSYNKKRGTLRGMHYQVEPHAETKIVSCRRGSVFDVALDLRPDSKTFKQWEAYELTMGNFRSIYIPKGLAHGFLTLEDDTQVFYQISANYYLELSRGVRWNDPMFGIEWRGAVNVVSEKDCRFPLFQS